MDESSSISNRRIEIEGVRIDAIDESQVIDLIFEALAAGRGGNIATVNTDLLRLSRADDRFRCALESADLRVADGMPLVWMSRLMRAGLPARVTGADLIWSLSERAAREGRSLFLLGAPEGVADRAAEVLQSRYPELEVVGTAAPAYGFESDPEAVEKLSIQLQELRPDLVFVALGSPRQERFIASIRADEGHDLDGWWMGVGAGLEFVAGVKRRAPVALQRAGLEWAFRLATEPQRLARRYLRNDVPYLVSAIVRQLRHPAQV